MRTLLLVVSVLGTLPGCFIGDCGEDDPPQLASVASGSYESIRSRGEPLAGIQHPGPVAWMEVDREAGLVRLHGTSDDGEPFVETWRIAEATVR